MLRPLVRSTTSRDRRDGHSSCPKRRHFLFVTSDIEHLVPIRRSEPCSSLRRRRAMPRSCCNANHKHTRSSPNDRVASGQPAARRPGLDRTIASCSSCHRFHPKIPVFSGPNPFVLLFTPHVFVPRPVAAVRRLSVAFFVNELQFDQGVGDGLRTNLDGQLLSNLFQSRIVSFRNDLLEEFVMRFEFDFRTGFRFDGFERACFPDMTFEFGDEGLGHSLFFVGGDHFGRRTRWTPR